MRGRLHHVLSRDAIAILVAAFGAGRRVRIPWSTGSSKAQAFEILIGMPETCALIENLGGEMLYLPGLPPRGSRPEIETDAIHQLTAEGMSAPQIARHFRCSERTVHSRRRQARIEQAIKRRLSDGQTAGS